MWAPHLFRIHNDSKEEAEAFEGLHALTQPAFAEKRKALIGLLRSGGLEDVIDQIAGLATCPTKKFQEYTGMTNSAGQPVKQNYDRSVAVTN